MKFASASQCLPDGSRCGTAPYSCCGQCIRGFCLTEAATFWLTSTDCGNHASGGGAEVKITQCYPDQMIVGQKTKVMCEGHQAPPYPSVSGATFDIKSTSYLTPVSPITTDIQCSGDAAQSKTCRAHTDHGLTQLTFHAMEFPLKFRAQVTLDFTVDSDTFTTTVAKATAEDSRELFCIKVKTGPKGRPGQCLPDGEQCGDGLPQYCCHDCVLPPYSLRGLCAPAMVQKGNRSQTVTMPQQETSIISV